ncbi:MAG: aspartate kinase [Anaerolineae bacterium]
MTARQNEPCLVMKFGGTSVADAERIAHVAQLVGAWWRRAPADTVPHASPAVVVSAMAGVTNTLIESGRLAAQGNTAAYQEKLAALREKHCTVADALLAAEERQGQRQFIESVITELSSLCASVALIGELPMRALDRIAGMGEKLSASQLAATLRAQGCPAQYVDATQVLVTDSTAGGATPLMEETRARAQAVICPILAAGAIPVITGYIGADARGVPTTLGRQAGDYSAAIFGAVLDAEEVWIWTDVDGILTADPKVVPQAHTLSELTYVEVAQLSYFGAEVLHPKTVRPLVDRGIPLRIRNTFNPDHPGTLVVERSTHQHSGPRAIITSKGLSAIAVVGNSDGWSPTISARALNALARAGAEVLMFGQSFVDKTVSLLVRGQDSDHAESALRREFAEDLQRGALCAITVQRPVASVSVVGAADDDSFTLAARTFAALGKQPTHVLTIAQAYSEYNVTFVVPQAEMDEVVRLVHAELGLG